MTSLTRRIHTAMTKADAFAKLSVDALDRGIGQSYVLRLKELREALDALPPDPF